MSCTAAGLERLWAAIMAGIHRGPRTSAVPWDVQTTGHQWCHSFKSTRACTTKGYYSWSTAQESEVFTTLFYSLVTFKLKSRKSFWTNRGRGPQSLSWSLDCFMGKFKRDYPPTNLSYKVCGLVPLTEASILVRLTVTWIQVQNFVA